MPPLKIKQYAKPKKGTAKRLIESLWHNFKLEIIISLIALILSIVVNLSGGVFASLITSVITESIKQGRNAFTEFVDVNLLNFATIPANIPTLMFVLGGIYLVGVLCSWTWTRTMAIVTQKYLNLFRIKMFSHMQKLPVKYFDTHQNGAIMSLYTNDIDTIRQFVSQSLPNMFATGLTVIGCLFVSTVTELAIATD